MDQYYPEFWRGEEWPQGQNSLQVTSYLWEGLQEHQVEDKKEMKRAQDMHWDRAQVGMQLCQ